MPRPPFRSAASILINSIDVQKVLRLVGENALTALTDYLVVEIDVLAKGGATLGLLAAKLSPATVCACGIWCRFRVMTFNSRAGLRE
jgi:hypothetical protein